jgi:glycosyltransferase involved in cell wall biosynthesis
MMRVLIVNDFTKKLAGAETFIHTLKGILEDRGHIVELFGQENPNEGKDSFFSRWYSFKWAKKVKNKIKKFKPDVVHVNNCVRVISPSILKASLRENIPTIVTVHDFHYFCPKLWGIRNGKPCEKGIGLRCFYSNCETFKEGIKYGPLNFMKWLRVYLHRNILEDKRLRLLAPSQALADAMNRSMNVKVETLNNGVDIPEVITKYEKKIMFAGGLYRHKGLQTILPSLNKIKEYDVEILGKGDLLEESRKKYKNINFLGFQKPEEYYEKASIGLVPSLWMENFSYSVIEAMSYGICVVGSNRGGIPEQIKHMKTGMIFEQGNHKDFEEKIKYLIENPAEVKRMGKAAREHVQKNWDWNIIVEKYEKVYQEEIDKIKKSKKINNGQ